MCEGQEGGDDEYERREGEVKAMREESGNDSVRVGKEK